MKKVILILVLYLTELSSYSQHINPDGSIYIPIKLEKFDSRWIATSWCYPVNHGTMQNYYNAFGFRWYSSFMGSTHLGVDISKTGEGNNDLGDTIYCVARGKVIYAYNDIIMILHKLDGIYVVTLYRHCMELFIQDSQYIEYKQPIGRIGNCNGVYLAHLHFELRTNIYLNIGTGYGSKFEGYIDPLKFIANKRKESYPL
jgi:murein DD-endopeptidase MepM/ murein hydrolase activator NlpD